MNSGAKEPIRATSPASPVDHSSQWSRISRGASTMYDLGPAYHATAAWVFQACHPTFRTPFRAVKATIPEPSAAIMAIRQRNVECSLFHRLPTEIMLMIEHHAEEEVIMALRGSCARFAHIFADPTTLPENMLAVEKWRRTYTHRRKIYQQHNLCMQERAGFVPHSELVCHHCTTTHQRKWFSASILKAPPEKRACIGWTSKLRLCAHKSVSLESLAWYKPAIWCGKKHSGVKSHWRDYLTMSTILDVGPFPPDAPHFWAADDAGGGRGVRLGIESREPSNQDGDENKAYSTKPCERQSRNNEREIVVRAEMVLGKVSRYQKLLNHDLLKLLLDAHRDKDGEGLCMCPHLTFAVVTLLLLLVPYSDAIHHRKCLLGTIVGSCATVRQDCPFLDTHDTSACPQWPESPALLGNHLRPTADHGCGVQHHCPHLQCGTSFYVHRARYPSFVANSSDEIVLCVSRRLGPCKDAQDKRWLLQVVESGST